METNNERIVIFQYGKVTIIQKWDGNHCISREVKGILTDQYDNARQRFFGEKVDLNFYVKMITEKSFETSKSDRIIMVYQNYKQHKAVTSVEEAIYYANFPTVQHMILNSFYKENSREEKNLRHIYWMGFDFELVKSDGIPFTHGQVFDIFDNIGFPPTFIKKSKSNLYHVILSHSKVIGKEKAIQLHKNIQKAIARRIGYEDLAAGASHPFSLHDKHIRFFGLNVIDFEEMKQWYIKEVNGKNDANEDENDEENKKKKDKEKQSEGVASFTEYAIWKSAAIKKLLNCEFDPQHGRAKVAFTIALLYKAMRKEEEEALDFLSKWRKKATKMKNHDLTTAEIRKAVRSAYKGNYWGPSKEYIEIYSEENFPFNLYHRYRYPRKTDNKSKEENRNAILDYFQNRGGVVEEMLKKDLIEDICGNTYAFRSIERHLDQLRKANVIQWKTQKGGNGGGATPITFSFVEDELSKQRKVEKETVIEHEGINYVFHGKSKAN